MAIQNQNLPDNPQIEVIKSGKTGLFTNYIYKAIPLAFDESMSYYETLCGLLHYLKNTIIPTVNNNADAVAELQSLYEQLRSYVDNYFTNLDVQEEINNKLDQMVADGTLPEIVASYLNSKAIFGFDNVESMKNSTNLINGSYAQTLGYYNKNDDGGAIYKITNIKSQTEYQEELTSGLYATLIINDYVNPEMFGAKGDGITNDTIPFTNACTYSKNIIGNGLYLINTISLNNVNIKCNIKTNENTGITFNNNVNYKGHIENGIKSTESAGGKCIYIIGNNNTIEDSLFDGLYTGCGIVLKNTSLNNKISNCIFDACFKVDVLISGTNVIVENCKFNEHTTETTSPISGYDNAIKITQYLDLTGTNGKNIVIKNNFMYEHGDNPIDCYTGGSNVIIDGNYIFSPLHECIEIKCGNANEDNKNYKIINNTLHGSRCIYIGQNGVGNIKNFIIDNNYLKNYANAGSIIINNFIETFISNCIFEYDNSVLTTSFGIATAYSDAESTNKQKIHIDNCYFNGGASVFSIVSDKVLLFVNNCLCENITRFSRINPESEFYINNCNIKTNADCFGALKGKIYVNNSRVECTYAFPIQDSNAIVSVSNSEIIASSRVFEILRGKTPKIGMSLCNYTSPSLCNRTFTPNVDFTTIS